jgi:FtsH-binding integral membrane protein
VRQAFGATALFVGGLGAGGYAIRRDLSGIFLDVLNIFLLFLRLFARE